MPSFAKFTPPADIIYLIFYKSGVNNAGIHDARLFPAMGY